MAKGLLLVICVLAAIIIAGCSGSSVASSAPKSVETNKVAESESWEAKFNSVQSQASALRDSLRDLQTWWNQDLDHCLCTLAVRMQSVQEEVRLERVLDHHSAWELSQKLWLALEAYRLSRRQRADDRALFSSSINNLRMLLVQGIYEDSLRFERVGRADGKPEKFDAGSLGELKKWLNELRIGEPPAVLPDCPGA